REANNLCDNTKEMNNRTRYLEKNSHPPEMQGGRKTAGFAQPRSAMVRTTMVVNTAFNEVGDPLPQSPLRNAREFQWSVLVLIAGDVDVTDCSKYLGRRARKDRRQTDIRTYRRLA